MLEEINILVERGHYEEALGKIQELADPIERVTALADIAVAIYQHGDPAEWIPGILEDAIYIAKKLKDPSDKVIAYSIIASSLAMIDYEEDAMDFFNRAIDETDSIKSPIEKGIVLSILAYRLALAGYSDNAFEMFNVAFDTIIGAEIGYTHKVDGIIRIGELLEKVGDTLPSNKALDFYRMAFDIFEKLHVSQKAAIVEKKIELAKTVYNVGLPEIRTALLEGRNHYALAFLEKKYSGVMRLIGELEVALWLKRVNDPEYLEIIDKAFEHCENPRFTDANVQHIARLLIELGNLRRALKFAKEIQNIHKRSEALKAIALELVRRKKFEEVKKVIEIIPDPKIREEVLNEIGTIQESQ